MQTLGLSTRGLRLLAHLNMDRLLMGGTLAAALVLAAYLGRFFS